MELLNLYVSTFVYLCNYPAVCYACIWFICSWFIQKRVL